jgi:predicted PurR-regulated permease PerM
VVLGLEFAPVTIAAAGVLMAIPFFGPFVAWSPPVLVAIVFAPDAVLPAIGIMAGGWVLVMNVLQPRLMERAVGIHPMAVLGSVLVGFKVAGVPGAIFGIPIAAVASAFFFHWFAQSRERGSVAERAAQLISDREGRIVPVPREPVAGEDLDLATSIEPEAAGER